MLTRPSILNVYFPQTLGARLIAPEVATPGGTDRADLVVYYVAGVGPAQVRTPFLVYEGKGQNQGTWQGARGQCLEWVRHQTVADFPVNTCRWWLCARGNQAKMWVCKRADGGSGITSFHSLSLIVDPDHGWRRRNGLQDNTEDGYVFNLTNVDQAAALGAALLYTITKGVNTFSWTA